MYLKYVKRIDSIFNTPHQSTCVITMTIAFYGNYFTMCVSRHHLVDLKHMQFLSIIYQQFWKDDDDNHGDDDIVLMHSSV